MQETKIFPVITERLPNRVNAMKKVAILSSRGVIVTWRSGLPRLSARNESMVFNSFFPLGGEIIAVTFGY